MAEDSMNSQPQDVINQMIDYLITTIERPHPAFGGLPICPFSRRARLADRILYQVAPFSHADPAAMSGLMAIVEEFRQRSDYDLLLVIHPEPQGVSMSELSQLTDWLNQILADRQLIVFDGHPLDEFNIQGVYTRKAPYIHLTIQTQQKVKEASDQLAKTAYYSHWTAAELRKVGMPR